MEPDTAHAGCTAGRKIQATQHKAAELARERLAIAGVFCRNGIITTTETSDACEAMRKTERELARVSASSPGQPPPRRTPPT